MNIKIAVFRLIILILVVVNNCHLNAQLWRSQLDSSEIFQKENNISESFRYAELALQNVEKDSGKDSSNYIHCLDRMARIYNYQGEYFIADSFYKQIKEVTYKVNGNNTPQYVQSLNDLCYLYQDMGNFRGADSICKEALQISKRLNNTIDPTYTASLNGLGLLCHYMGKYVEAELYYKQAVEISRKNLDTTLPNMDFAGYLNDLAALYSDMGNYNSAEPLYKEALRIKRKMQGVNSSDYAFSLNNLAMLCYYQGNYLDAENFFTEALDIRKRTLGANHLMVALTLNRLGTLFIATQNYKKALPLLTEALDVRGNTLGVDHPDYAQTMNDLAILYSKIGKYSKAELYFKKALNIRERIFGNIHPDCAISLSNLGVLYSQYRHYKDALKCFQSSYDIRKELYLQNASILNEKELSSFISTFLDEFAAIQLLALDYPPGRGIAFNTLLTSKALILSNLANLKNKILSSGDSTIQNQYTHLNALVTLINQEYSKPVVKRCSGIKNYEIEAERIEKEILLKARNLNIPDLEDFTSHLNIGWQDLKNQLKSKECIIEFSHIIFVEKQNTPNGFKVLYCAYILSPIDSFPQLILLFEEGEIDSLFSRNNYTNCSDTKCITEKINGFYRWGNFGKDIYNLVWRKLEPYLNNVNTIYFSASGKLHNISFAAIPTSDSTLLSSKYNLVQLNSSRVIALKRFKPLKIGDASYLALFGGIRYEMDTTEFKNASVIYHHNKGNALFSYASRSYVSDSSSRGTTWRYLPGTLSEVEFIKPLFKQSKLFTGAQATEEAFKSLQGKQSPDILHVATHGFFFKRGEVKKDHKGKIRQFEYSNDPLIRSGLMMAGGNLKWKGVEIPDNLEDGILTAKEVAALNLYNTKLVVLSACETGLGDIQGSEGVYGLQRAFKAAGADYLLMSLWTVPDKPTAEFMQTFYSKLKTGSDIQTAFEQTQAVMKQQYRHDPYNWAGFVLVR